MRKAALAKLSTIGFLLALLPLFQAACGTTTMPESPATNAAPLSPAATPDLQATITAGVSNILANLPPATPTSVPTPDLQAIVAQQVEASLAARPTPIATPVPTPICKLLWLGR